MKQRKEEFHKRKMLLQLGKQNKITSVTLTGKMLYRKSVEGTGGPKRQTGTHGVNTEKVRVGSSFHR